MKYIKQIIIPVLIFFQSATYCGYSHKIENRAGMPVRVRVFTFTGPMESLDLAPGKEVTLPGNFLQRVTAVEAEYRGMDPLLSGLQTRWAPVATPPPATNIVIEALQGQDPDTVEIGEDFFGNYIQPALGRRTALKLTVSEFQ